MGIRANRRRDPRGGTERDRTAAIIFFANTRQSCNLPLKGVGLGETEFE
jgi:hypothetical protein